MIYFDYAATTPLNKEVLNSYYELLNKYFANSASAHYLGVEVNSLQERARKQIADLLKVKDDEIIFTSGASEANNLALKGVALEYANRGKHIITTSVEHPSIINTCHQLEKLGYEITYLDVDSSGKVSIDDIKKNIRKDTILVSIMFVNNETGSINDIESIAKFIKNNYPKVIFHTDATQGITKMKLDLSNVDLLSMSAHKIYGLKGSGLLVKKQNINLEPLISGGHQEFEYRAGTSNWPANVALAKAFRIAMENMDNNYKIVKAMNEKVRDAIKDIEDIDINSPIDASCYILNISFKNKKGAVISRFFEDEGICISTVSACSSKEEPKSYVIEAMFNDTDRAIGSVRICFSHLSTAEEVSKLIDTIKKASKAIK